MAWLRDAALRTDNRVIIVSHALMDQASAWEPSCKHNATIINGEAAWMAIKSSGNVVAMHAGHIHNGAMFYEWIDTQAVFDEACKKAPVEYWLQDGVHPTVAGHGLIARAWMDAYKKM